MSYIKCISFTPDANGANVAAAASFPFVSGVYSISLTLTCSSGGNCALSFPVITPTIGFKILSSDYTNYAIVYLSNTLKITVQPIFVLTRTAIPSAG